jgi:uncharacterized surface protein with fasciclin (FAS1) repeats
VETVRALKACTVFVPVNSAFGRLPAGMVDKLRKPEQKEELVKFIRYHIIASLLRETSLDGNDFKTATLGGQQLCIDGDDPGGIKVGDGAAKIGRLDVRAGNCGIHEIDRVLLPPSEN